MGLSREIFVPLPSLDKGRKAAASVSFLTTAGIALMISEDLCWWHALTPLSDVSWHVTTDTKSTRIEIFGLTSQLTSYLKQIVEQIFRSEASFVSEKVKMEVFEPIQDLVSAHEFFPQQFYYDLFLINRILAYLSSC